MESNDWKLRLFASADVVGATRFKAGRAGHPSSDWVTVFREFFNEFPEAVEAAYHNSPSTCFPKCRLPLRPWKFAGDEVLFVVEILDHNEVVSHLSAFRNALRSYPAMVERKFGLRLKGACWLAGFPYTNCPIEPRKQQASLADGEQALLLDFIGPSMDSGFRIAQLAEPKRLVLSADLAWMLFEAIHDTKIPSDSFEIHYLGRKHLKGVGPVDGYPVFAISIPEAQTLEDKLASPPAPPRQEQALEFLRDFLGNESNGLRRPFIVTDPDPNYSTVPADCRVWLERQMEVEQSSQSVGELREEPPTTGKKIKPPDPASE